MEKELIRKLVVILILVLVLSDCGGAEVEDQMVWKSEIHRLRAVAEAAFGPEFQLSEFHAVILGNSSMPLSVLEEVIEEWIAGKGSRSRNNEKYRVHSTRYFSDKIWTGSVSFFDQ